MRSSPSQVVSLLKERLDFSNLENFRMSCFGRYLDMLEMSLQCPFIYVFLRHVKPDPLGERILCFGLKGVNAKFGPEEFFSINGLSFGPPLGLSESFNFVCRIFGLNRTSITKDIQEMFLDICDASNGSGDDALRLGRVDWAWNN